MKPWLFIFPKMKKKPSDEFKSVISNVLFPLTFPGVFSLAKFDLAYFEYRKD